MKLVATQADGAFKRLPIKKLASEEASGKVR